MFIHIKKKYFLEYQSYIWDFHPAPKQNDPIFGVGDGCFVEVTPEQYQELLYLQAPQNLLQEKLKTLQHY